MPNIREFVSPVNRIQPTEMGSSAFELEGRHVGSDLDLAGRYVGGAVEKIGAAWEQGQTENEVAKVNLSNADLITKLDQSKQDFFANADQNDPNVAKKWIETQGEPAIQSFIDATADMTPAARRVAEQHAAQLRVSYTKEAVADQANLSAIGSVNGLKDVARNFTQRVNATNLDSTLDAWDTTVNGVLANPNLKPEVRQKLTEEFAEPMKHQMVFNAAYDAMTTSPVQFSNDLAEGKWDKYGFTPEDKEKLTASAERVQRSYQTAQAHQSELEKVAANERANGAFDQYISGIPRDVAGNPRPTADWLTQALKDPAFSDAKGDGPAKRRELLDVYDRLAVKPDKPVVKAQPVLHDLAERAKNGALDDAELTSHVGVDISPAEYNFIKNIQNGKRTAVGAAVNQIATKTMADARSIIYSRFGGANNPDAADAVKSFNDWYIEHINQLRDPKNKTMLDPVHGAMALKPDVDAFIAHVTGADKSGNVTTNAAAGVLRKLQQSAAQAGVPAPAGLPSASADVQKKMMDVISGAK